MKKFTLLVAFGLTYWAAHSQTKYYCAVSDNKAAKDIVIAFPNGLKIDELGGTPYTGTVTYNTGKNEKVNIYLTKIETAVDEKGRTGERKYFEEQGTSGQYIITEWPMGTVISYISEKKKRFEFHCEDEFNFSRDKAFSWYKP